MVKLFNYQNVNVFCVLISLICLLSSAPCRNVCAIFFHLFYALCFVILCFFMSYSPPLLSVLELAPSCSRLKHLQNQLLDHSVVLQSSHAAHPLMEASQELSLLPW